MSWLTSTWTRVYICSPNGIIRGGTIGIIGGIPVGRPASPVVGMPGNAMVVDVDAEGWVNVEDTVAVDVVACGGACVPDVDTRFWIGIIQQVQ